MFTTARPILRRLGLHSQRLTQLQSQLIISPGPSQFYHHSSRMMATAAIPKTMKGVIISKNGGSEVLEYKTDIPVPTLKDGEILVKNEFVGVNYIDTYHRSGLYPTAQFPRILGQEGEGTVISSPPANSNINIKPGDKVVYLASSTYAEYSAIPAEKAYAIPPTLTPGLAAASYLQGLTALTLVHEAGFPIVAGDYVLVHSAAGGVGLLLIQILSKLGAHVIGTASTKEKLEEAKANGAEFVFNYSTGNGAETLVDDIKNVTPGGEGVKVVFDGTGAGQFENDLVVLKRKGVLVSYGNSGGPVPPLTIARLAAKNLKILRPTLFGYTHTREELEHYSKMLYDAVDSGDLKIKIHKTYPLEEVRSAHDDIQGRGTSGKLLLQI